MGTEGGMQTSMTNASATTETDNANQNRRKENNRNAYNTGGNYKQGLKKFVGGNASLQGKTFEINVRDAVHQYTETVKAIAA